MPVPLHIDTVSLARAAARRSPRLASILMATHQSGEPLRATSYPAGGSAALGSMLVGENPLAGWLRRLTLREVAPVGAPPAPAAREHAAQSARRTLLSPIAEIYKRLRMEAGGEDRAKTADELLESAQPAPAGRSAAAAAKSSLIPASSRQEELALLCGGVVRYCFGGEGLTRSGGVFEGAVFSNLNAASNVIAPGKALSAMSSVEVKAIVTAAVHASNPAFLSQLRSTSGMPQVLSHAVSGLPAAGKVAEQFLKNGQFDEGTFKTKTQAVQLEALKLLASSPATIKIGLLAIAAQKASHLIDELPAHADSVLDLAHTIRDNINSRVEALHPSARPADNPAFEHPTAPGA